MKVDNRIWVIITVFVCLVIVAGGWFLGVEPRLSSAAQADQARSTIERQNQLALLEIARLEEATSRSEELEAQLSKLRESIPPGVDGSSFISSLDHLIAAYGVTIKSVNLAEPIAYTAIPNEAGEPFTNPLVSSENFVIVPVRVSVTGPNDAVLNFLSALQSSTRLILVTEVDKDQDNADPALYELTVSGNIYVLRDPVAEAALDAADSAAGQPADEQPATG